jgi:two-component system, OmpR family, response regulator
VKAGTQKARKPKLRDQSLVRILAIDDDPDVLEAATLALGKVGGYVVQTCLSGNEAVRQCASFRPDLVLLDVMMPGMDGFATLKALRELETTRDTPVVFMTALAQRHEIAHYRSLGCQGVILKPVDLFALPEMLQRMWSHQPCPVAEQHQREFDALRLEYMRALKQKLVAMRDTAASLAAQGWDRPPLEMLYQQVHRMAGTSGLYKLPALSRSAGALEDILKRMLDAPGWPPPTPPQQLITLVKALERTAGRETRPETARARAPRLEG